MTTWAVDPGAVASGLAWLAPPLKGSSEPDWYAAQFKDPTELYKVFTYSAAWVDTLLLEDYSHGGAFTTEAKQTLEIVGFIYYTATMDGYKVKKVHKDKRLSGQGPAAELMGSTVSELKKNPYLKDAFSALSHCVVFNREGS